MCVSVCLCVRHRTPQKLLGLRPWIFAHMCVLYRAMLLSIFRDLYLKVKATMGENMGKIVPWPPRLWGFERLFFATVVRTRGLLVGDQSHGSRLKCDQIPGRQPLNGAKAKWLHGSWRKQAIILKCNGVCVYVHVCTGRVCWHYECAGI